MNTAASHRPKLKRGDFHTHIRNDVIRLPGITEPEKHICTYFSHKPYRAFLLGQNVYQIDLFHRCLRINNYKTAFFSCLYFFPGSLRSLQAEMTLLAKVFLSKKKYIWLYHLSIRMGTRKLILICRTASPCCPQFFPALRKTQT